MLKQANVNINPNIIQITSDTVRTNVKHLTNTNTNIHQGGAVHVPSPSSSSCAPTGATILSFSAGTTSRDKLTYRVVGSATGSAMVTSLVKQSPWFAQLASRPPPRGPLPLRHGLPALPVVYVHCYPASLVPLDFAINIDAYVSTTNALRAIKLCQLHDATLILGGQPLFLAHVISEYIKYTRQQPQPAQPQAQAAPAPAPYRFPNIIVVSGGCDMPVSLEKWMYARLSALSRGTVEVIHMYGLVEVDMGVMIGTRRDKLGNVIYFPRDDVKASIVKQQLVITKDGITIPTPERTRKELVQNPDGTQQSTPGFIIESPDRLDFTVKWLLDSWDLEAWDRRTGFLSYDKQQQSYLIQTRLDIDVTRPHTDTAKGFLRNVREIPFFDFLAIERVESIWTQKPKWNFPTARRGYDTRMELAPFTGSNEAGLAAAEQLHYDTYVTEMKFGCMVSSPARNDTSKRLGDVNNPEATFFNAYNRVASMAIGTIRLNVLNDMEELRTNVSNGSQWPLIRELFRPEYDGRRAAHLSRCMVHRVYRKSDLLLSLFGQVFHHVVNNTDLELVTLVCQDYLLPVYQRIGFRPYGQPYHDRDFQCMEYPLVFIVRDIQYLDRINSPLTKVLQAYLQNMEPTTREQTRQTTNHVLQRAAILANRSGLKQHLFSNQIASAL